MGAEEIVRLGGHHELDGRVLGLLIKLEEQGGDFVEMLFVSHGWGIGRSGGRHAVGCPGVLAQGDEFFGAGGVDGDRAVEVGLAGAHLERDGKALQHLVGAVADDVQADDALVGARAYQFPRSWGGAR